MALIGNTVTITGEFVSGEGSLVDATDPVLNVYGPGKKLLTSIILGEANKTATGTYQTDYLVPDGIGELTFELIGTVGGTTEIGRVEEPRVWV
jgi:hypothetical protein